MKRVVVQYRIAEVREEMGWTRRKLSLASGISYAHLRDIENNESQCTIPMIWQLALALGCSPHDLYDWYCVEE